MLAECASIVAVGLGSALVKPCIAAGAFMLQVGRPAMQVRDSGAGPVSVYFKNASVAPSTAPC